ncbi:16S rRNA (cytosine(1402)-N(4))-methyltransferase RsmH [bacterium]|nr:16S rRNA (cytosine(1402)-N(4))-methyltransferase RsmH [bacterium]
MDGLKKKINDRSGESGSFHNPVMGKESVSFLLTDLSGIYVDSTLGGGGHAELFLSKTGSNAKFIGIDRDREAVKFAGKRLEGFGKKFTAVKGRFSEIDYILSDLKISTVDGIFLDLGISSYQIDTHERGFSYLAGGPLDMRMDAEQDERSSDIINSFSEKDLADLFYVLGEERLSRRIARKVVEQRKKHAITTSEDLAEIVRSVTPYKGRVKVLSRIWQALRFAVNDELSDLQKGLEKSYLFLRPGGRIVVISYESLMDRMVKRFFKGYSPDFHRDKENLGERKYLFKILTKKVVRPSIEEMEKNSRARSALLRAAEKRSETEETGRI